MIGSIVDVFDFVKRKLYVFVMYKPKPKKTLLTCRANDETVRMLDRLARDLKVNTSEAMRQAIETAYLVNHGQEDKQ